MNRYFHRNAVEFAVNLLNLQESVHALPATAKASDPSVKAIESLLELLQMRLVDQPVNIH